MTTNELAAITTTKDILEVMREMCTHTLAGPLTKERIDAFLLAMALELNHVVETRTYLPSSSSEAA